MRAHPHEPCYREHAQGTIEVAGQNQTALADGREKLLAHLVACGYARCEPALLQPASAFLELRGEDIRGRLYLTTDTSGEELCLRPEYTIPVCRAYLGSAEAGHTASFSYLGPVFRQLAGGPGETVQAGLESFGRTDREAADADVLACALEAAQAAGAPTLHIRFGDAGLSRKFLDALALPPTWSRRIAQGIAQGRTLDAIVQSAGNGATGDHSGVLAALDGVDKVGARALVEDLLSIAGISSVGGRSAGEIAERFLEQAALRSGPAIPAEKKDLLAKFLVLTGEPDAASAGLRRLAGDARLDLGATLDAFDRRIHFLAARGIDLAHTGYAAGFARRLDYYTGFVFEGYVPEGPDTRPLVGGGRYDALLRFLGAASDIPAVGAAIYVDRLAESAS